ncbi:hypothetical protein AYX14_03681 [Cryptococcus neoformans]|nr:hypothetical protein AYX15_04823 [Cryptococcus neoformans var. grubii]OWZ70878.1 hypothetical protein AYX14_03681 [Cryptococcus neoformans var. grubii]OXG21258.1 hypothetical protein C366_01811 [Cryptococcus neoformans var. grubii Tu401-1]OXM80802.1 hypothetical protein C364_01819 [Cryptococcus neoformans var. grubii Bt63]
MPHPHTSIAPYPQPGDSSPHKTQSQDSLALQNPSSSGSASTNSLQLLDNDLDDPDDDLELGLDDMDLDEEESDARVDEPLVRGRGGRRRARRYKEEATERGLLELIPSLILSHPLPLLPLLALLPYNFLPAGVVFFVPVICILALLSVCAHIVIVYLAWYLKVPSFEDVFANVTGKYGKYGLWGGRLATLIAVLGMLVSWLGTLHPLVQPIIETYFPANAVFSSRVFWTLLLSLTLLPSLIPSRMTRSLHRSPFVLVLLLPIVAFLIIGRTVEIRKASEITQPGGENHTGDGGADVASLVTDVLGHLAKRRFGLAGGSSAGAGLTTLTIFFSPHVNTLPIHSTLARTKRSSFFMPCLISGTIILILSLPLALVPYYLLPMDTTAADKGKGAISNSTIPSGVFAHLPADDGWVNLARLLMVTLTLGSTNMWILRGRDVILKTMDVDGGNHYKIGRWVGFGWWVVAVSVACLGGWVADKTELIGVLGVLAVGWFLPSLFFIITFHVRSPLSIIFPSRQPPPNPDALPSLSTSHNLNRRGHSREDSLNDPSTDVLLARKERQLQKRRLGRRLWQDLIVYVGIMPVGCVTLAWTAGRLVGLW